MTGLVGTDSNDRPEIRYWVGACAEGFEVGIKTEGAQRSSGPTDELKVGCPLHGGEQITLARVDADRYAAWEAEQEDAS